MAVNLSMLAGAGAQFFTDSGVPLTGGLVYTYAAGTTTPQATYTTSAGNVAHTNPIVLNSAGRVASGGEIWLTDAVSYKFVLQTSAAVTIATYDNITGNASGILTSLAASSGSSLVGFIQAGTGAVATTVQTKLRESVSVKDFGADPTASAAVNTAAFSAALTASPAVEVLTGDYDGTELVIPANKVLSGKGFVSTYLNRIVVGAKTVLRRLRLAPATNIIPLKMTLGADDVVIDEVTVSAQNYATTFDLDGTEGLSIRDSSFTSDGFAILTNNLGLTTPAASKRVSITNNYAKSVDADAIELNHPSATVTGAITTGNFLETTGTSVVTTAGFAYGNADTKQWVFANNVVLDSRLEAIHIEDSQRGGTVVGNSVHSRSHGLLTYPEVAGAGQGSFPIVANNFYAPAKVTPPGGIVNSGVFISYASPHSPPNGMPIVGNVVEGFTRGIFLRPALETGVYANIQLVDNNHLKNNTYSLRFEGGNAAKNRQFGTNFSTGTAELMQTTGTWSVGKIYSDSTPTTIISTPSGYNNFMPSCVDGFGYPLTGGASNAGAPTNTILFPAGANNRFFGRCRFEARRSGVADWIYYSADILWDGSTLTETNILTRNNVVGAGAFATPNFNVSAGNCRFSVTTTNAVGLEFRWVEFDGEYYDA
jgi:hypothetical protein